MTSQLIKQHLDHLSDDDKEKVKKVVKATLEHAWYAGVNYANDQADWVEDGYPNKKKFTENFLK